MSNTGDPSPTVHLPPIVTEVRPTGVAESVAYCVLAASRKERQDRDKRTETKGDAKLFIYYNGEARQDLSALHPEAC